MKKVFSLLLSLSLLASMVSVCAESKVYRAAVRLEDKAGLIDETGAEITGFEYDYIPGFNDSSSASPAAKDGKYALIDANGNEVTPFIYEHISPQTEGMYSVMKDGLYGYINTAGEEVVPCIYSYVSDFDGGAAIVQKGDKYFIIDKNGTEKALDYNFVEFFSEGMAVVHKYGDGGGVGYINTAGEEVIPLKYERCSSFKEGLAFVMNGNLGGFIDKTGAEVAPMKYEYSGGFFNGFASVMQNEMWTFVDKTGKEITPFIYSDVNAFYEGYAAVQRDDKYGFINESGEEVIPLVYDYATGFSEGLAGVEKSGKLGYIDTAGNEIIPPTFTYASPFKNGYAAVHNGTGWGFIDKQGNIVVPAAYSDVSDMEKVSAGAAAPAGISVLYNNEPIEFDQPPIIENGRTLVPFRAICQALGADVSWDGDTQQVSAVLGDVELVFTINVPTVLVNGTEKSLDQVPIIKNGRTLLPARAFAEEFGARVGWDEATRTVIITK